jgi:hypothetical protein
MRCQNLRDHGDGTFGATLPRDQLEALGIVDEDGELVEEGQNLILRLEDEDRAEWTVRLPGVTDDGADAARERP